jgi:hypothetical protein
VKELGRGNLSIVCLYEEEGDTNNKIAVKAAREDQRFSSKAIN